MRCTVSEPIHVNAMFESHPGQEQALASLLLAMVAPSRAEPGCRQYDLFRVQGTPGGFVISECYADQAALEAHRQTGHYQAYRGQLADLLSAPVRVQLLQAVALA